MTAVRKFEWMHDDVEQEPIAVHRRFSAMNDDCLNPLQAVPGRVLPAGGFAIGASEWVATQRRGIIGGILARSSISRRIQEANHPLLLARSQPKKSYSRILVPVDFSHASASAAKAVLRAGAGTQIVFLTSFSIFGDAGMHGHPRPATAAPLLSDVCRETRTRLARFVEQSGVQAGLVSIVTRHGELDAVTRSYADLMRADLIVIGRHRPVSRPEAFFLGRPEWRLSQEVGVDVLVVPE